MKNRYFIVLLVILAAIQVHAGSISCSSATSLVPDGRLLDFDSVQASTANWYQFTAIAGRSYSVEVRDDLDQNSTDFTITYYGPNGTCPSPPAITSASATVTDTHAYEPVLPALTSPSTPRASIVTTSTGSGIYWIKVQNTNTTTSHYLSISVTETTLYSPFWNTNSSFATQWILQNTTSQAVNLLITLTSTGSTTTYTSNPLTLGALSSSSGVQVFGTAGSATFATPPPSGLTGSVIITHNGPPGAVMGFANEYNFSSYPSPVQTPIPIGPMRGK